MNKCPTCGQSAVIYKRQIRKPMLRSLVKLYMRKGFEGAKLSELGELGGDFGKLRFWGLIEPAPKSKWRLTGKGYAFLCGQISVPQYVWIYNNKQVHQPEEDHTQNNEIYAKDILAGEWFPINKDIALMDSVPFKTSQIPLLIL